MTLEAAHEEAATANHVNLLFCMLRQHLASMTQTVLFLLRRHAGACVELALVSACSCISGVDKVTL